MTENKSITEGKDLVQLDELAEEFDKDMAKELALAFLEDSGKALPELDQGLLDLDHEKVRANAHMLKGCSRVVKAMPLEECASALESAAKSKEDWSAIKTIIEKLKEIYSATKASIDQYVGS